MNIKKALVNFYCGLLNKMQNAVPCCGHLAQENVPKVVHIDPCGKCNFRCYFCPCNHSEQSIEERHKIMPLEMFTKIIDDIAEFSKPIGTLFLYAYGEPLINPNFVAMCRYAKQKNIAERIHFTTNGYLLNRTLNQELIETGIDKIRISIEALDAVQYREICGITINWDHFLGNISDLHKRANGILKIEVKGIDITLRNKRDVETFKNIFGPITDRQHVERVEKVWPGYEFSTDDSYQSDALSFFNYTDENHVCLFPWQTIVISSNGDVGLCCADWNHDTKYGNILNSSVKQLWESSQLSQIREWHRTLKRVDIPISACKNCKYVPPKKSKRKNITEGD